MKALPIVTRRIEPNEDIFPLLVSVLPRPLKNGDVLIVTSKVISFAEGQIVPCRNEKELHELIAKEADEIVEDEESKGFLLTKKQGMFLPNAGIDRSNVPEGYAVLLPKNAQASAEHLRNALQKQFAIEHLGILIVDSRILPFRQGISGIPLGIAGFSAISDERGKPDLFGKPLRVSQIAVADVLAAFAQLFFGQSAESCPFLLLEDAPVFFTDQSQHPEELCIDPKDDLFHALFREGKNSF